MVFCWRVRAHASARTSHTHPAIRQSCTRISHNTGGLLKSSQAHTHTHTLRRPGKNNQVVKNLYICIENVWPECVDSFILCAYTHCCCTTQSHNIINGTHPARLLSPSQVFGHKTNKHSHSRVRERFWSLHFI